jgi:hypothetical protein
MAKRKITPTYPSEEAKQRFEATLRGALSTPPKPLKKIKPAKAKVRPGRVKSKNAHGA